MDSDLFIPPPDIRVRIVSTVSRRALISNMRDDPDFSHTDMAVPYDDHYWYIRPGKGQYAGQYMIVSAYTDRCLRIHTRNFANGDVGTFAPIGIYADHYFDLVEQRGRGARAGQFRIHTPSVNAVLFSRTNEQPELGCVPGDKTYDDHYFTFDLEPLDLLGIEYDLKAAVVKNKQVKSMSSQKSTNASSREQVQSLKFSETIEEQSTFEAEVGLELGVSTEVSCGVPVVAGGKVEVSAKVHSNLKWGRTNTRSQTWEATVELRVGPGKIGTVTATAAESILNVPFVSTWRSVKTGKTMAIKGTYKGIGCSDFATSHSETKIPV